MAKGLSEKQKAFVEQYLIDLNATAAAGRAGYKDPSIGRQLITKNHVAKAIEEAKAKRLERVKITQDEVLRDLIEIKERCLQRAPVMNMKGEQVQDAEGNHLWAFNAKDGVKALELLGKHLKMFTDKIEHSGELGIAQRIIEGRQRAKDRN